MEPFYERDGITIYVGDNRDVLPHIEQVHAVVTDPPYGLEFMGKAWDKGVPGIEFWQAISAAMLPGAHLLAFGGTRTYHRMAVAIEDAGYEIRDTLQWLYGSGFPKSHDVSKHIDKMAGAERTGGAREWSGGQRSSGIMGDNHGTQTRTIHDAPATPEAEQWQGWGTALKPAYEPVIMARKPFKGTVAANVLAHGTGALNIDASRVATGGETPPGSGNAADSNRRTRAGGDMPGNGGNKTPPAGRWPSNVILDEEAAAMLDAQSGERKGDSPNRKPRVKKATTMFGFGDGTADGFKTEGHADTGGASRFFYCAKSSRRERNAGLDGMPEREAPQRYGLTAGGNTPQQTPHLHRPQSNAHPTVKPIALMRYLIQMVTPPGGIVLDPFAGSGSTLVAAAALGFPAIGIELSEEYAEIAARRVDHALNERAKRLPGLEVAD